MRLRQFATGHPQFGYFAALPAIALGLLFVPLFPIPEPAIPNEFSYLLGADDCFRPIGQSSPSAVAAF